MRHTETDGLLAGHGARIGKRLWNRLARSIRAASAVGAICTLGGCGSTPPPRTSAPTNASASSVDLRQPQFEDITESSGIKAIYQNGQGAGHCSIVESLGGGVGVCDFDRDGRPDLFFPGGGRLKLNQPLQGIPGTLWRNSGRMRFAEVSAAAAINTADFYSHGCAIADYDNDGFPDILVTGYGGLNLFRNQGDGTFAEVHDSAALNDDQWSSSAAWGDFDGDGNADLYVVHYVDWSWENHPYCPSSVARKRDTCSPQEFRGLPDLLYLSNGDGTFRPSPAVKVAEPGKGLGVVAADINADTQLDVYVANDTTANLLFVNQGGGEFREEGVISGTAFDQRGLPNGSMGLAVLDFNRDSRPDLWVTNYEQETFGLYHNDGGGAFRCVTDSTGISALGNLFVGFGTVAADFTRSGFEDLVVTNGHVMQFPRFSPVAQQPLYLQNDGGGKFTRLEFSPESYFDQPHRGRGVVATDLDGDGKLDLVFSHTKEPAAILRQETDLPGNWLAFDLVGRHSNRDAIGAKVVLETTASRQQRWIVGGGSYLSQNPYRVYFGWPQGCDLVGAEITWPDGKTQRVSDLAGDQLHTLIESAE